MLKRLRSWNPWPASIVGFFVLFFSGLLAFIVFSTMHRVDLVRPDYYEAEMRYQQQLERVRRTHIAGEPMVVRYNADANRIELRMGPNGGAIQSGIIHLYRPSDARLDQRLPLRLDQSGSQRLDASQLRSGLWNVRVEWTAGGEEFYFASPIVVSKRS